MKLQKWEPEHRGRGILIDPDSDHPTLVCWRLDESGKPFADQVIRHLGVEHHTVLRFDISQDGGLSLLGVATAGRQPASGLDERRAMHVLAGLDHRFHRDADWEEMFDDPEFWRD